MSPLACAKKTCISPLASASSFETPIHNLLTVKETAKYLRIPLPTIYYLVQRGKIPAIQIGGRWRIKKSSLDHDILRQDKQSQPLVVDDDLGVQDLFRTFLKQIGFSRVVVGTAKEKPPEAEIRSHVFGLAIA